jgi:hypothetical protein
MKRRNLLLGAAAAVIAIGGAGVAAAVAAGVSLPFSGDGNTINGCYSAGGALKVLTPTQPTCPAGYIPIQWNVTGPAGPQGPQGPQGPPGPKGDPGSTPTLSVHRVLGPEVTIPAGTVRGLTATCSGSDLATGGGFNVGSSIDIVASEPDPNDAQSWFVIAFNPSSLDITGTQATVQCLRFQ